MIDWQDLLTAFALLLVLEGILPFLNPSGVRKTLSMISEMNDGQIRKIGTISMALGLLLLFLVKA